MLNKFIQGVAEGFVKEAGKEIRKQLAKGTVETTKKFVERTYPTNTGDMIICS